MESLTNEMIMQPVRKRSSLSHPVLLLTKGLMVIIEASVIRAATAVGDSDLVGGYDTASGTLDCASSPIVLDEVATSMLV